MSPRMMYESFSKNIYQKYETLCQGGNYLESYDSLLISLEGAIIKPFSLKYLADVNEASP